MNAKDKLFVYLGSANLGSIVITIHVVFTSGYRRLAETCKYLQRSYETYKNHGSRSGPEYAERKGCLDEKIRAQV
jgi:hypothetical protein